MGKEETLKTALVRSIIEHVRANYADAIDKAYDYFWDEKDPGAFLHGTALALGFANFEDWLVFDYKAKDSKETFIDAYIKSNKGLKDDELVVLDKLKKSLLSLYEVVSISKNKKVKLKDLLLGGKFDLNEKVLKGGLKEGDIFSTRLLALDNKHVMANCVYPYKSRDKKMILSYIDRMFGRYKRNENPDGTIKDFLKDYGDVFNMAWINIILNEAEAAKHASKKSNPNN